jgi:hypothetical protein
MRIEGRKHWVTYLRLVIDSLFAVAFVLALLFGLVWLEVAQDYTWFYVVAGVLLSIIAAGSLYRYLELASVRWMVTERRISISSGVLPWKKFSYQASAAQLFDSWSERSFFGWLLGYANVRIRLRDGTTHFIRETHLAKGEVICHVINGEIERHNETSRTAP